MLSDMVLINWNGKPVHKYRLDLMGRNIQVQDQHTILLIGESHMRQRVVHDRNPYDNISLVFCSYSKHTFLI